MNWLRMEGKACFLEKSGGTMLGDHRVSQSLSKEKSVHSAATHAGQVEDYQDCTQSLNRESSISDNMCIISSLSSNVSGELFTT